MKNSCEILKCFLGHYIIPALSQVYRVEVRLESLSRVFVVLEADVMCLNRCV